MSARKVERMPRSGRTRSVALVAAACAIAAAGGYTGALWVGGDDLDAVQIETGHLDVRILKGEQRVVHAEEPFMLTDSDGDGVTWFVGSTPFQPEGEEAAPVWTVVDVKAPLVYPGETWVAAIPFTVKLEGHNLLADLTLGGTSVLDALEIGEAGFTVADGVVAPGQPSAAAGAESWDLVDLDGTFTIPLSAKTQTDDAETYTLLLTFQVPGSDDEGESAEVRGLKTAIENLAIVLQQNRSAEGDE